MSLHGNDSRRPNSAPEAASTVPGSLLSRTFAGILSLAFVLLTWAPLVAMAVGREPDTPVMDMRDPNAWPELHLDRPGFLREYLTGVEAYWADRFGLRRSLIWAHSLVRVGGLGVSSSPQVIVGKDGWLFYTGEGIGETFRVLHPHTPDELARLREHLEEQRRWLAARGIAFLLVIVPEKQTIYPDRLPRGIVRLRDQTRMDQIVEEVRTRTSLDVIDLRPALLAAKGRGPIYLKLDTHWNDLGAYQGYRAIADWIASRHPAVVPFGPESFELKMDAYHRSDLPRLLGLRMVEERPMLVPRFAITAAPAGAPSSVPDRPVRRRHRPVAFERSDAAMPRVLLYHDSFARAFTPWLAEHCERLACVNASHYPFDRELVLREMPDVVIHQVAERYLGFTRFR